MPNEYIVGHDAGDQIIAVLLSATEEIEVADMEKVEGAGRIADADNDKLPSSS